MTKLYIDHQNRHTACIRTAVDHGGKTIGKSTLTMATPTERRRHLLAAELAAIRRSSLPASCELSAGT